MRLVLQAAAKINLDLRVFARRADGFHEVRTLLQTLALHDTLVCETAPGGFHLSGDPALMPLDRSNLVWRAAAALWRAAGRRGEPRGARVRVVKRIPARAGLGGGSSDAAAALAGLAAIWKLPAGLSDLAPVAATIGADVPFFLVGGAALGAGRGEIVYPLADLPARHVLLALPDFGVATSDAYGWLAADRASRVARRPAGQAAWALDLASGCNDLERAVERRHPAITALRRQIAAFGADLARMSGSGSAVFGLFRSEQAARQAAARLAGEGHRVLLTRTRGRNTAERRRLT